jgi:hypothetical protein
MFDLVIFPKKGTEIKSNTKYVVQFYAISLLEQNYPKVNYTNYFTYYIDNTRED